MPSSQHPGDCAAAALARWTEKFPDPFAPCAAQILEFLDVASPALAQRLLCHVYDVVVHRLGDVFEDLPADVDPEHYFASAAEGDFDNVEALRETPTKEAAYRLAATELQLKTRYARDFSRRQLAHLAEPADSRAG